MSKVLIIGGEPKSLIQFRGKLLESFKKYHYKVVACANGSCPDTISQLSKIGVDYVPARIMRASFNPLNDLIFFFQLILIIRRVRPDIVLTYTVKPVIYGMLATRLLGIKKRYALITGLGYAFTSVDTLPKKILIGVVSFLYKIALLKAAIVFFQNNNDLDFFKENKLIKQKVLTKRVMGSGVDINYYSYTELPTDKVSFLLIARLLNDKGIREYVKAAELVKKMRPNIDVIFSLLGPFDTNPSAIQPRTIEKWVDAGHIQYEGEAEDVRPYIAKCSVFVLPSYREGMPRSVLEAMSMGRAIITTDSPGCRDTVIENINGYLVPVKSINELSNAMISCLDNRNSLIKMGIKSRSMIEKDFDVQKVNNEILKAMEIL
ncbi:glycosyltransferase family 4 protein [Candidatus Thioglobus sp.]|nr:glycosyltransferase family 4 protein [Candidatus Thioglobus sp.]